MQINSILRRLKQRSQPFSAPRQRVNKGKTLADAQIKELAFKFVAVLCESCCVRSSGLGESTGRGPVCVNTPAVWAERVCLSAPLLGSTSAG